MPVRTEKALPKDLLLGIAFLHGEPCRWLTVRNEQQVENSQERTIGVLINCVPEYIVASDGSEIMNVVDDGVSSLR